MKMVHEVAEIDYVERCGMCGMVFIGLSPEEYRREHDCHPTNQLMLFPKQEHEQ